MINIRNTIRISNKKTSLDGGFFLPSRLVSFYSGYFLLFQLFRFLIFSVHFYRFEMDSHMGICAEVLLQFCFYMSSMFMRLIERERTRHADMHFYRNLVSDATGTQVMNLSHSLFFICNLQDFIFLSLRKTGIRQFLYRLHHQSPGSLDDEGTHDDGCKRIEHRPLSPRMMAPPIPNIVPILDKASLR